MLVFAFLIILFSPIVYSASIVPKPIEDLFLKIFRDIPKDILNGSGAKQDNAIVVVKVLIWILFFALTYFGAHKIFGDEHKNIAGAIAVIIGLLGTIMIPKSFILFIMGEYSAFVAIALGLFPLFIALYVRHMIPEEHNWIRNTIGLLACGIGLALSIFLAKQNDTLSKWLSDYLLFGSVVGTIIMTFSMFMAFRSRGRIHTGPPELASLTPGIEPAARAAEGDTTRARHDAAAAAQSAQAYQQHSIGEYNREVRADQYINTMGQHVQQYRNQLVGLQQRLARGEPATQNDIDFLQHLNNELNTFAGGFATQREEGDSE